MKPGYLIFLTFYLSLTLGLVLFLSLSRSSSPSATKPIDHSAAVQARRSSAIHQLQKQGIINKVACDPPPCLWILPAFYALTFADQSAIANAVYAYCFSTVTPHNVLLLRDKKTGKPAGQFSPRGLELK